MYRYQDHIEEILFSINEKIRYNSIDSIFRRGALSILELSVAVFLIKLIILFSFKSAIVGGAILSISAVLEYLIWRASAAPGLWIAHWWACRSPIILPDEIQNQRLPLRGVQFARQGNFDLAVGRAVRPFVPVAAAVGFAAAGYMYNVLKLLHKQMRNFGAGKNVRCNIGSPRYRFYSSKHY